MFEDKMEQSIPSEVYSIKISISKYLDYLVKILD